MTGDRIVSLACVLIAIAFGAQTRGFHYNGRIFPLLTAVLLLVLSSLLFIQSFFKKHTEQNRKIPVRGDMGVIIGAFAIVIVWVNLLTVIGFIVTSVVSLTVLTLMLDLRRISFNRAVFTIAMYTVVVVVLWYVFHSILLVPLPSGCLL